MQKTIPIQLIVHPMVESLEVLDQGYYLRFIVLLLRNKWRLPIQVLDFWPHGENIIRRLPELYSIEADQITAIHGRHIHQVRQKAGQKKKMKERTSIFDYDLQSKSQTKNRCESEIPIIPVIPVIPEITIPSVHPPKKASQTLTKSKNVDNHPPKIIFELSVAHLELFNKFWKAYPHKTGKQTCKIIWDKLKPDKELVKKMLVTLEWQRHSKEWIEGFIPHPSTWLNGHRWEDEPPENLKVEVEWDW